MRSLRYRPIRETPETKKEEDKSPAATDQPVQQPDSAPADFDESVVIN